MLKVWMAAGVLSALVASLFIMATVCLTHLTQLKVDIEGFQSDVHSKLTEYSNALQDHTHTKTTTKPRPQPHQDHNETTTTHYVTFAVGSSADFKTDDEVARIPMDIILHNYGAHFHMDDYAFHAPLKGVYYFTVGVTKDRSQNFVQLYLVTEKADGLKVKIWREVEDRGPISTSLLIKLDESEMVSVWLNSSSFSAPSSLFVGELLYRLD